MCAPLKDDGLSIDLSKTEIQKESKENKNLTQESIVGRETLVIACWGLFRDARVYILSKVSEFENLQLKLLLHILL